jgi:hypothetical protein
MDMYAMGVILYMVFTGHRPMLNREAKDLLYSHYEAHEYPHMKVMVCIRGISAIASNLCMALCAIAYH